MNSYIVTLKARRAVQARGRRQRNRSKSYRAFCTMMSIPSNNSTLNRSAVIGYVIITAFLRRPLSNCSSNAIVGILISEAATSSRTTYSLGVCLPYMSTRIVDLPGRR